MAMNQSRQNSSMGQIDCCGAWGNLDSAVAYDPLNTIAANHDKLIAQHFS